MSSLTHFEAFLGREARSGSWEVLAKGTYRVIAEALGEGDWDAASALIPVTLLEAEELHDVYGTWPAQIQAWTIAKGVSPAAIDRDTRRLWRLIGAAGIGYAIVLLFTNLITLGGDVIWVRIIPWFCAGWFVLGLGLAYWVKWRKPDTYEHLGRVIATGAITKAS